MLLGRKARRAGGAGRAFGALLPPGAAATLPGSRLPTLRRLISTWSQILGQIRAARLRRPGSSCCASSPLRGLYPPGSIPAALPGGCLQPPAAWRTPGGRTGPAGAGCREEQARQVQRATAGAARPSAGLAPGGLPSPHPQRAAPVQSPRPQPTKASSGNRRARRRGFRGINARPVKLAGHLFHDPETPPVTPLALRKLGRRFAPRRAALWGENSGRMRCRRPAAQAKEGRANAGARI